ncbi:alanine--tRNA ligase [Calycomorphotria hydatis]|uniref:Alanine--tRNA ligase n=1 Tax=Calycomorphotria hydatis TaxID=2528027 RepID=A0A517TCK9_9PLAN|nr:alanine--tRNA ligase [Calycomorphotria hydatis]QDT66106.1 Alanine--tRNA ligase [Calycomorphotria hydatis]
MKTDELRECYLSFFESKGCTRRPSDVLVPKDDPTVLFTPAGMNQFKNEFLGLGRPDFKRATTCQKCIRTGDIENVGVTAFHHTFFEMLGNFSFGDYFKREAIHWGWEFLTDKKWLGLNKDQLSVTVYLDDDEAFEIWEKEIGVPPKRIIRNDEYENFWPAGAPTNGPDGVCGPCSEIYFHPEDGSGEVEIWNLVFTQFNRVGSPPDNLSPLPKKNIDTGMGLERTAAVLQGKVSNYEIDSLRPLCVAAGDAVSAKYAFNAPEGRALRRIADHVRAITMCIHEGVQPGNHKENYIVRQLLRRAVLEGYLLGRKDPFLHSLVPTVIDLMKSPYPELSETVESVRNTIEAEEMRFLESIDRGVSKYERCVEQAKSAGSSVLSGDEVWDLHETYGFLVELTEALAAQHNLGVDRARFNELRAEHEQISKGTVDIFEGVMAAGPLDAIRKTHGGCEFLGYDTTESDAKIIGIIAQKRLVEHVDEVGHETPIAVVLDKTPFYGEAGGQVGDTGTIKGDGFEFDVIDTQKDGELVLHVGHLRAGELKLDVAATATVISDRRAAIRRAHSATHILHHALHEVIGKDATQRGSKVEPDALRFDFNHRTALTPEELTRIEDIINVRIAEGGSVSTKVMPIAEAKKLGAMALFGEKYPDNVRVVTMGDFSVEFCGGTHLTNTGQVGFCKLVSEDAVGTGVRRISAVTGRKAIERVRKAESLLTDAQRTLKASQPDEVPQRIEALQDELKTLRKELADQKRKNIAEEIDDLLAGAEEVGGVKIIALQPAGSDREILRSYADQLRNKKVPVAVILGMEVDGKVALLAAVSKELIKQGVKAGDCVKIAAKIVGGGGGGRPDLAEAGGKQPEKIPEALAAGVEYFKGQLAE